MTIPVFYRPEVVANAESYSPSAAKPARVVEGWRMQALDIEVLAPAPVRRADFYRAHDAAFVDGVLAGELDNGFGNCLPEVAASLFYTSGAMLAAARAALASGGAAVAPVAGFHHAGYDVAGGYCTFNGLMVTALALMAAGEVQRVGILDYDYHYGDGTDDILRTLGCKSVAHITAGRVYQGCRKGARAEAFLNGIDADVQCMHGCDVLLYQAGADPHLNDPLGGWLTTEQMVLRDARVFAACKALGLPVAWNLAGGYQKPLAKVLALHDNTLAACLAVFG